MVHGARGSWFEIGNGSGRAEVFVENDGTRKSSARRRADSEQRFGRHDWEAGTTVWLQIDERAFLGKSSVGIQEGKSVGPGLWAVTAVRGNRPAIWMRRTGTTPDGARTVRIRGGIEMRRDREGRGRWPANLGTGPSGTEVVVEGRREQIEEGEKRSMGIETTEAGTRLVDGNGPAT